MRWLDGITNSMDMSLSKLCGLVKDRKPGVLQSMGSQRVRHGWATEQQQPACMLSRFSPFWLCDAMDCSLQAPLFMRFYRQEYQTGLPCPPWGLSGPRASNLCLLRWVPYHYRYLHQIDNVTWFISSHLANTSYVSNSEVKDKFELPFLYSLYYTTQPMF